MLYKSLDFPDFNDSCIDMNYLIPGLSNSEDVETKTYRDLKILWLWRLDLIEILLLSRLRLIETWKFCGCRDRNSLILANSVVVQTKTNWDWDILCLSRPNFLRLENSEVVETETHWDWEILWFSRQRPIETKQKLSRTRLYMALYGHMSTGNGAWVWSGSGIRLRYLLLWNVIFSNMNLYL